MTDEQLRAMSEQEIRARFRCAPGYYLQAKLERKRTLEGRAAGTPVDTAQAPARHKPVEAAPARSQARPPQPTRRQRRSPRKPVTAPAAARASGDRDVDLPLPGFEILDAALYESGGFEIGRTQSQETDPGATQQAILEAALEDYANWPLRADSHAPSDQPPISDLERKLALVLDRAPELELVLGQELEPELEVVLESAPELQQAMALEAQDLPANVTVADFGQRAPRTVPVVSVVMDRKRPNMVRVVGKSTRLAG